MSQKAESLLKSWKGAQAIVELSPLPRYVILTLMCLFGLFVSSFILTGYLVPILTGALGGGLLVYISILSFNVAITRDHEKRRRKTQEEQIELIRHIFQKEGAMITQESLQKFIAIFLSVVDRLPEDQKKTYEMFNDAWKDRIRKAEDDTKIESEIATLNSRMDKIEQRYSEDEQLLNKKTHTQNTEDE